MFAYAMGAIKHLLSRRQAAERFGVNALSAILWLCRPPPPQRWRASRRRRQKEDADSSWPLEDDNLQRSSRSTDGDAFGA
jgi:hypothetical protein